MVRTQRSQLLCFLSADQATVRFIATFVCVFLWIYTNNNSHELTVAKNSAGSWLSKQWYLIVRFTYGQIITGTKFDESSFQPNN